MEKFRFTATGSSEEMDALEQVCRQTGLLIERGLVSGYEGVAVTLFAVYITGGVEDVAQCLADYRRTRQTPLKASCFLPRRGHLVTEDFSPASLAKILQVTDQLHFEAGGA